jgi:hypothetical protein
MLNLPGDEVIIDEIPGSARVCESAFCRPNWKSKGAGNAIAPGLVGRETGKPESQMARRSVSLRE